MKIVITGGHLTPALAVIEELKGHEVLYVGRKYALEGDKAFSLEYRQVNELKIPFKEITAGRLQRKFTIHTIPSLLKLPIGFFQSLFILKKEKPDVVLGFGSYVSVPVIFAAVILRIPIIVHEQTLSSGLSNKIASIFARKICISWESSRRFFPQDRTVLTGNPIRQEIIKISKIEVQNSKPLIYITGGSLGSHVMNLLVEASLEKLLENYDVINQTGDAKEFNDFERLEVLKNNKGYKNYIVKKFLDLKEVADVLGAADLVVSRAGMNTISELIFLNKPCFLIPLPQGFEQTQNALFMKKLNLAEVGFQNVLSPLTFTETINFMIKNINEYKTTHNLLIKDASKKIADIVLNEGRKT